MSLSKYNYESLAELYCYWYYKAHGKLPPPDFLSKAQMIKMIWIYKRVVNRKEKSNEAVRVQSV